MPVDSNCPHLGGHAAGFTQQADLLIEPVVMSPPRIPVELFGDLRAKCDQIVPKWYHDFAMVLTPNGEVQIKGWNPIKEAKLMAAAKMFELCHQGMLCLGEVH